MCFKTNTGWWLSALPFLSWHLTTSFVVFRTGFIFFLFVFVFGTTPRNWRGGCCSDARLRPQRTGVDLFPPTQSASWFAIWAICLLLSYLLLSYLWPHLSYPSTFSRNTLHDFPYIPGRSLSLVCLGQPICKKLWSLIVLFYLFVRFSHVMTIFEYFSFPICFLSISLV